MQIKVFVMEIIGRGEKKQFHCTSSKNGFKCKKLRK